MSLQLVVAVRFKANDAHAIRVLNPSLVLESARPHCEVSPNLIMSSLQGYVDRKVLLVLQDGRAIVGTLFGFDQRSNVVLSESVERIYSIDEGVEEVPLGLYLVKGDMIVLIGEMDAAVDSATDLSTIRAEPLPAIRY
ncbi:U6 snRNA-associated-like-Sm protein lsm8 [Rhizoctonia solani AG-3 Rhs1AP]|uniref:LSM2-LSM8 complex subunit LSM8 n=1 Tax=Rhizoctonia solani AG-3 Rhs1AP TaxID=1086054 RepID=X8JR19_9AGAM|nr:U6 snRNA-associated-like-Sm protein lsm8 [Rhizoctonia solani AG-3 Rhs1AP]